jgi:predicted 3-demethylubiquinone-9 3-methyltransferase (glyoxalase superfamily)
MPSPFEEPSMPTITPFLWFDNQAEQATNFYASIFKNSKVIALNRAQGQVMSTTFELEGQRFIALNAGPAFKFTEAVSFFIGCETQQEIDELWAKLTADGGSPGRCGWLKDKFGLSWQVVASPIISMIKEQGTAAGKRAMEAMMQQKKPNIAAVQRAYDGAKG